eukprot:GILJ01019146.1.p1 GENE.GILJ01019146.1~~GILJ01019146.1.p1  ORF type:complete len:176 (+),score=12.44 GILJ01019146.1:202-729(+)
MARVYLFALVACLMIFARSVSANKVTVTYYPQSDCQGTPRVDTFELNQCVSVDFSIPVLFTRTTQTLWAKFHTCDATSVTATGWISNGANQCPSNNGGDSLNRNTDQCYQEQAYPAGFSSSRYGCIVDSPQPQLTASESATTVPTATLTVSPTPTATPTSIPVATPTTAPTANPQ